MRKDYQHIHANDYLLQMFAKSILFRSLIVFGLSTKTYTLI